MYMKTRFANSRRISMPLLYSKQGSKLSPTRPYSATFGHFRLLCIVSSPPSALHTPLSLPVDITKLGMLHDDTMTPGSPGSADAVSILGGGGSSLGDLERRSARLSEAGGEAANSSLGGGERGPSDESGGEGGGGGWGKQWAAHRRSILREFGGSGGDSGADTVRHAWVCYLHVHA